MSMNLVYEDKHGAYSGVRTEFLKECVLKESNTNFEVYDSKDGRRRYIAVKSSRLPDDEDLAAGKYGINFHRAKPGREDAERFHQELSQRLVSRQALSNFAFAAASKEEYDNKSAVWDKFYTYIWSENHQSVWVNPHSGIVNRKPDDVLPYPKQELDNYVSGVTARCVCRDSSEITKRTMISIHSHNWFSAVIDLGGFGINEKEKLENIAAKIEEKYAEKVSSLAEACRKDSETKIMRRLEHILKLKATLNPKELPPDSVEQDVIKNATKGLKLYHKEIEKFTLEEFEEVIQSLKNNKIRVASVNHLFSAEKVGQQIEIVDKINRGLLHGALQMEFMKYYLKNAPELSADITLDVKKELLDLC
jgi:hypothetical protein